MPSKEPKQRRSGCPTAMESGMRTDQAVDSHRRNAPNSSPPPHALQTRCRGHHRGARTHRREGTVATRTTPHIPQQRTKTTAHSTSPSPPRPAGRRECTAPPASTPFSLASTAGRERQLGFDLRARCEVLDPLLGVDGGRSASPSHLRPPEHLEAADQHRQASDLGR
jgi:hypothetical protein